MNIQDLFPLGMTGLTGLINLRPRDSQEPSPAPLMEVAVFAPLYILASFVKK